MIRRALVLSPLLSLALLAQTALSELPEAISDYASGLPGQVITPIPVLSNDVGPQGSPLTISAFTQPQKGTVADNEDGTLSYTPNVEFTAGKDSFTYTVSDGAEGQATGTVYVTISSTLGRTWPTYGGGPEHTGFVPVSLSNAPLTERWSLDINSNAGQVTVADGKIFVCRNQSTGLAALDEQTGGYLWKKQLPQTLTPGQAHSVTWFDGAL
ncbi:MAG: Ig-like domain-containing protein, partial [Prosthecobacter sp.]|nr:Ig-like domain-containing protein [Prosthecobacter sp.]